MMKKLSKDSEYSMQVTCMEYLDKGKRRIMLDNGDSVVLYRTEVRSLGIEEGMELKETTYQQILHEIIGKRAKKRALHLLEKMDRTEAQLREKLSGSEYPLICIDEAIAYVKQFHYLDDFRYACNFVRYKQEQFSRQQIKQKLMAKGISRDLIERAIDEEYISEETEQIRQLLKKKHYSGADMDSAEFRKIYQYLLRRGFKSNDILKEMRG